MGNGSRKSYDLTLDEELVKEVNSEFNQPTIRGNVRDAMQAGLKHERTDQSQERMMWIIHGLLKITMKLIDEDD